MNIKFEHKIVAVYLVLGGLWIAFSDIILLELIEDRMLLSKLQTYKGWFYVLLTGAFFFILLKRHLIKLRTVEAELLKKNEELQVITRKAEESARLKTIFLQNISHELRTPMNGIIGFSQILLDKDLSADKQNEYLKTIVESTNQLLRIVHDILEISKIETGSMELFENTFLINDLLDKVYTSFLYAAERKGNKLKVSYGNQDMEFEVFSDEQKIKQVLNNLITNANLFTRDGIIEFGYEMSGKQLMFFVSDTGIGIEEERYESIFERFGGESGKQYDSSGTGLGLAISRGLLGIMEGKIWVSSRPGKGSIFYFTIPLKQISFEKPGEKSGS
jgi:signal transduction histidine kinase